MSNTRESSRKFQWLMVLLVGITSAACSGVPERLPCRQDSDCQLSDQCLSGTCRTPKTAPPSTTPPPTKPPAQVTASLKRTPNPKVDILFVVDNSCSMREEQEKLAKGFSHMLKSLKQVGLVDVQIGVISTDMDDPSQRGLLQGSPRILSTQTMTESQLLQAFQKNVRLGTRGTSFEKPLDALRAALSPKLLNDPNGNKGFLRPGAWLKIFFVTDEDDCSHNGSIPETEVDSSVCYLSKTKALTDDQGNVVPDHKGQPVHGYRENLTPVSDYIKFLKGLQRQVHIGGLIGSPVKSAAKRCTDISATQQFCGGCQSRDAQALPGLRLHELIKAFGGEHDWSPICGDERKYQEALSKRALPGTPRLNGLVLPQAPDVSLLDKAQVSISFEGSHSIKVPRARPFSPPRACQRDADCGKVEVCGQDSQCYGNGWVHMQINQTHRLVLSGLSKLEFAPDARHKTLTATYTPQR